MSKSVSYSVVPRKNPQEPEAGVRFYAQAQASGDVTVREMSERIQRTCTVTRADVAAVLTALEDVIVEALSAGEIVRLADLGLLLFLAEVGTSAGKNLVATFEESGMLLFGVGAAITLVPMLVAVLVGRLVFNISLLDLLGTITGGMTSTPGLAAADSMSDSSAPSIAYATVYPIAMVFLILFIQFIAALIV